MSEPTITEVKNTPTSAANILSQKDIDAMSDFFRVHFPPSPGTNVSKEPKLAPETKQPEGGAIDVLRKIGSLSEGPDKELAYKEVGKTLVDQAAKLYTDISVSGINIPGQTLTGEVTIDKDQ